MASCNETPDPLGANTLCSGCTQVTWTSLISKLLERNTEGCLLPEAITHHWCRPANPSVPTQCLGCSLMFAVLGNAETGGFGIKTTQSIIMKHQHHQISERGGFVLVPIVTSTSRRTAVNIPSQPTTISLWHQDSAGKRFSPRLLNPRSIDYSILRTWLSQCMSDHAETCSPSGVASSSTFKVLHCRIRKVVTVETTCSYVALSYVWGHYQDRCLDESVFPQTIEDAMTVTLMLGFEHLWIDRYCIDQDNGHEKHEQIRNMGNIYSGASLLIIAAAGDSPSYGLPGVSHRSRQIQHSAVLTDCTLVEIYPDLKSSITASKWATRAWTYQEGHLARRRLIFTDQQVAYVCGSGVCLESLCSTIKSNEMADEFNMDDLFSSSTAPQGSYDYDRRLREFTSRQLSYGSDALNACLGVLDSWSTSPSDHEDQSYIHLWGIRMTQAGLDLSWYHDSPGSRRDSFPTWSWASSEGPINHTRIVQDTSDSDHSITSIELGWRHSLPSHPAYDHDEIFMTRFESLEYFYQSLSGRSPDLRHAPRLLKISGICPQFRLLHTEFWKTKGNNAPELSVRIALSTTRSILCGVFIDNEEFNEDFNDCVAISIESNKEVKKSVHATTPAYATGGIFLLLKPTTEGMYQRIGLIASGLYPEIVMDNWSLPVSSEHALLIE